MKPTVLDIISILEALAPEHTAEPWDNSGFQLGDKNAPVHKVAVSLDPTPAVIADAVSRNAELLVTHHPLIFPHITHIDRTAPIGDAIARALAHGLSIYCSHTPLDHARRGTNFALAEMLKLLDPMPILYRPGEKASPDTVDGIIVTGTLKRPAPLATFAEYVRDALGATRVRYVGEGMIQVHVVSVCGGSGGDYIALAGEQGANVFVTGEIRHHQALAALDMGMNIVEAGHHYTEWCTVPHMAHTIREEAERNGFSIDVEIVSAPSPFVTI